MIEWIKPIEEHIVTFEEIEEDKGIWGCDPCSRLDGNHRAADVALVSTYEDGDESISGLCCHHAEVIDLEGNKAS